MRGTAGASWAWRGRTSCLRPARRFRARGAAPLIHRVLDMAPPCLLQPCHAAAFLRRLCLSIAGRLAIMPVCSGMDLYGISSTLPLPTPSALHSLSPAWAAPAACLPSACFCLTYAGPAAGRARPLIAGMRCGRGAISSRKRHRGAGSRRRRPQCLPPLLAGAGGRAKSANLLPATLRLFLACKDGWCWRAREERYFVLRTVQADSADEGVSSATLAFLLWHGSTPSALSLCLPLCYTPPCFPPFTAACTLLPTLACTWDSLCAAGMAATHPATHQHGRLFRFASAFTRLPAVLNGRRGRTLASRQRARLGHDRAACAAALLSLSGCFLQQLRASPHLPGHFFPSSPLPTPCTFTPPLPSLILLHPHRGAVATRCSYRTLPFCSPPSRARMPTSCRVASVAAHRSSGYAWLAGILLFSANGRSLTALCCSAAEGVGIRVRGSAAHHRATPAC